MIFMLIIHCYGNVQILADVTCRDGLLLNINGPLY